ncbi:MAG: 3'-5' exonuclease domain-containing protein 2 [Puniceicoccales bacterium]|nr:3'-5' exonuclease domain-containing protein 2 [Puniceicoccales bacterium]
MNERAAAALPAVVAAAPLLALSALAKAVAARFAAPPMSESENEDTSATEDAPEKQPSNGRLRIEKETIAALPLRQYTGSIILVEDPEDTPAAVARLAKERVLGFDTESRPSFHAGTTYLPSLIQLAGENAVWLFRLDACGGVPPLFPILRNPKILKVGVAVRDDIRGLQDRAPFKDGGFVEISTFTRRAGIENTGLKALAAHYLGLRISKGAQVTNWANRRLTPQQITYAATDAWVSRELYLAIEKQGLTE